MSKLFISSKSGKSLSENAIKHRMKNLIKVKLKKNTEQQFLPRTTTITTTTKPHYKQSRNRLGKNICNLYHG